MVPLTEDMLTIDYVARRGYPLIFVTSGKLGSVNHTLLSFEAIRSRGIKLHTLAYNLFPHNDDMTISNDTKLYIKRYMERYFPETQFVEIPVIK
jgi:dethiobiotin synthetase